MVYLCLGWVCESDIASFETALFCHTLRKLICVQFFGQVIVQYVWYEMAFFFMLFICFSQLVPWMRQEGVTLKSVSNPGITTRFHHSTMEPTTQQLPSPSTGSYVLWVNVFPVLTICGTVHNYWHWDGDNFLVSSELKYLHSRDSSTTKKICRTYVPHLDPIFCETFSPDWHRTRVAMGPVGSLGPHSQVSSTSWVCCSSYLTNTSNATFPKPG